MSKYLWIFSVHHYEGNRTANEDCLQQSILHYHVKEERGTIQLFWPSLLLLIIGTVYLSSIVKSWWWIDASVVFSACVWGQDSDRRGGLSICCSLGGRGLCRSDMHGFILLQRNAKVQCYPQTAFCSCGHSVNWALRVLFKKMTSVNPNVSFPSYSLSVLTYSFNRSVPGGPLRQRTHCERSFSLCVLGIEKVTFLVCMSSWEKWVFPQEVNAFPSPSLSPALPVSSCSL